MRAGKVEAGRLRLSAVSRGITWSNTQLTFHVCAEEDGSVAFGIRRYYAGLFSIGSVLQKSNVIYSL